MPLTSSSFVRPAGRIARGRLRAVRAQGPTATAALVMLGALVAMALLGPLLWGAEAQQPHPAQVLRGPSAAHPFGTDHLGRDLMARVLAGTRPSLLLALAATLLGGSMGVVLGAATAVVGDRVRRALAFLIQLLLAFPAILTSVFFAVVLGAGARGATLALAVAMVPGFARIAQTLAAGVAEQDFLQAARLLGLRRHRLLLRHVLPNIAEPLVLHTTVSAGAALVALSGLSFLGLGVQPPGYDWGVLLGQGLGRIYTDPLTALAPGLAILWAGLAFQLLGEAVAGHVARRSGPRPTRPSGEHVHGAPCDADAATASDADADAEAGEAADAGEGAAEAEATDEEAEAKDGEVPLLSVAGLTVRIPTAHGTGRPVDGVGLVIRSGERVGLVGESGSGKSLTALALADLLPPQARLSCDARHFLGRDLGVLSGKERDRLLATGMATVFQNPASALNPALSVGTQLTEAARTHLGLSRAQATERALAALRQLALPDPARLLASRPHQLSGGQRQRVLIAAALMTGPRLLVLDEPTTALDTTVQRQVVELLRALSRDSGTAVLFISHDLALVTGLCDRVLVMYGGTVVESVPAGRLAAHARHPYTRELVGALTAPVTRTPDAGPGTPWDGTGCPYLARCAHRRDLCAGHRPPLLRTSAGHHVACWYPLPVPLPLPRDPRRPREAPSP
ncbi:dipeptide/oligopeptide/nickel ABC transporter permease/ATP-binding protein [Streptomyces sp. NPDC048045]|uniref:dipeptide/oligopeptide/nickel ABC transporter permease/ATP-binding protein n=1 Tax=Streptomyces sp. NPDC048045 TaxID=3154710 RepID=UPI00341B40CE